MTADRRLAIATEGFRGGEGGATGTYILGGIRTVDKLISTSAKIGTQLSSNFDVPNLSSGKLISLSAKIESPDLEVSI